MTVAACSPRSSSTRSWSRGSAGGCRSSSPCPSSRRTGPRSAVLPVGRLLRARRLVLPLGIPDPLRNPRRHRGPGRRGRLRLLDRRPTPHARCLAHRQRRGPRPAARRGGTHGLRAARQRGQRERFRRRLRAAGRRRAPPRRGTPGPGHPSHRRPRLSRSLRGHGHLHRRRRRSRAGDLRRVHRVAGTAPAPRRPGPHRVPLRPPHRPDGRPARPLDAPSRDERRAVPLCDQPMRR